MLLFMVTWKIEKIDNWYIKLIAPKYEKREFAYESERLEYSIYLRRYTKKPCIDYLFVEELEDGFKFGVGWSTYLIHNYYERFDQNSIDILNEYDPMEIPVDDLYDYQLEDLNNLLKFKRGIFQVYTGYGKTQIIASLVNYLCNNTDLNFLVICPGSGPLKALDERLKETYDIYHDYFDYESNCNIINSNGFPNSSMFDPENPYWSKVDLIICDEVENCLSDSATMIYELCTNCKRIYGFSATADKDKGDKVTLEGGNIPVVQRNKWLINYFGFSSVFRKPQDFIIHYTHINTTIFQDINDNLDAGSEFSEIVYNVFTDPRFCRGLVKIIQKEKGLFVPMFRLQVIDYWIENYFTIPEFVCVNICGRGFELYIGGELQSYLTLAELNELVNEDMVDVIVGTKTSFNALDIPNLKKAMILHSKLAGMVIQAIGRVTRKKEFTLIDLIPYRKVTMYSRDLAQRDRLIRNYYSQCKFIETTKLETSYGIY